MPSAGLLRAILEKTRVLVAVDGGLRHCRKLRVVPNVVIGDLDSASEADLDWARHSGSKVRRMPEQNNSDIEKALEYAQKQRHASIVLTGIDGDRPDHFLHAVSRSLRVRGLKVTYLFAAAVGVPMRGRCTVSLEVGAARDISWFGVPHAAGCSLSGVRWPFSGNRLELGLFQSLSNRTTEPLVCFRQQSGNSLIIVPSS